MGGRVPVTTRFFDQAYLGGSAMVNTWPLELIEQLQQSVKRKANFTYDTRPLYALFEKRSHLIAGRRGLVIGSESPWLEAMLLFYGASHVTTLEFGEIQSAHPQLDSWTPSDFSINFLSGNIEPFDFAFTFSSLEHDGLGRYGDVLNPIGDLQTMARLRQIVKPGGWVFAGFGCCYDLLEWNAHRVYGPLRLPRMFAGYKLVAVYPSHDLLVGVTREEEIQPVFALQNRRGCSKEVESTLHVQ